MAMDSYYSIAYLALFLPLVIVVYTLFPKKGRWAVLLGSSLIFFWCISGKLVIYLLASIVSIHYGGIWIALLGTHRDERIRLAAETQGGPTKKELRKIYQKKQMAVTAGIALFNVGLLLFLKYTPFFMGNINRLLAALKLPAALEIPAMAVPIGISFYALQAVSYIMDVYWGKIPAQGNICRLALYMCFFPRLIEGPICRFKEMDEQLFNGERIHFDNLVRGSQRIVFGMMKKLVVADRLNLFIKNVYENPGQYDGGVIAMGAVLYTCQLYMDFSGTMDIVLGTGEIFGIRLPENFRQPFFSKSISQFWQRWHITLGTWFKDYIFYPVSMLRPMKKLTSFGRKHVGNYYGPLLSGGCALFCVWLCNGLWHGSGWNYIFFGMYHFALIFGAQIFEPAAAKICKVLHIPRKSVAWGTVRIVRTAALVCVGEMFFRAHGLKAGLGMFVNMVTNFTFASVKDGSLFQIDMDKKDFLIVAVAVLIVFINSILKEKSIDPREWLGKRGLPVRWGLCYGLILFVIIFGAYGVGYVPLDPIYAGF